jgi:predicted nuclease with RNAse H fold/dephospho-CoA kinase
LWFKFCRVDIVSLRRLIAYNNAEIEGMKKIFDILVDRLLQQQKIPSTSQGHYTFASNFNNFTVDADNAESLMDNIQTRPYQGSSGPKILLKDLDSADNLSRVRVVGIDLTGAEERLSGWCLMEGDKVITRRVGTNLELIRMTVEARPLLVSIDSPLSLPKGRISVSDDDPGRGLYGIMRSCERELKKRGINVYPSLIKSMQKLTARGMYLAEQFRSLGFPVIESYPGAAQDIMGIPRKGASLEFLKNGLAEFGVVGDYLNDKISHDELDAITSAIVGVFFWSGRFEALGNIEEDFLIIPDLQTDITMWRERVVVGLSGPMASGKTTVGKTLQSQGFFYTRYSLVLADILRERGLEASRENLQELGEEINKKLGQRWLCWQLFRRLPNHGNLVIDGLRFPDDHAFMVERFGPAFRHIHVNSPAEIRRERYLSRGGSYAEFEEASSHPVESSIAKLASLANAVITNNNDLDAYLVSISSLVDSYKNS